MDEFNSLNTFVSLQAVRTPAFRKTIEHGYALMMRTLLQAHARSKDGLKVMLEKAQAESPTEEFSKISVKEMQEFILDDSRYTLEAKGDHFLGRQLKLQDDVFRAIVLKKIGLLISDDEPFITSDHPVCLVPRNDTPPLYGGFLFSDVIFPIGRRASLVLITQRKPEPPTDKNQRILVLATKAPANGVRNINKVTIAHAENFLFANVKDEKIQELFDGMQVPTRIHVSSPFSRRREQQVSPENPVLSPKNDAMPGE